MNETAPLSRRLRRLSRAQDASREETRERDSIESSTRARGRTLDVDAATNGTSGTGPTERSPRRHRVDFFMWGWITWVFCVGEYGGGGEGSIGVQDTKSQLEALERLVVTDVEE